MTKSLISYIIVYSPQDFVIYCEWVYGSGVSLNMASKFSWSECLYICHPIFPVCAHPKHSYINQLFNDIYWKYGSAPNRSEVISQVNLLMHMSSLMDTKCNIYFGIIRGELHTTVVYKYNNVVFYMFACQCL